VSSTTAPAEVIAPFSYRRRPLEVRFGRGAATEAVRAWVEEHDARRIMLVASRSQADTAEQLAAALGTRVVAHFADVVEHVPSQTAEAARQVAADSRADLLLCVGGGSTTGTAKAVALSTGLPVLAVPTTLAGSEMTDTWGITTDGRKRTGKDPAVLPRAVVYDSVLLRSLPERLAVTSAFNAMAHCVEALWAPSANPVSSVLAGEAVHHLARGLRALRGGRPDAPDALDALQYGSFLAGVVFAEAGSGLHHTICHALGGTLDLPHAATHTVVLPQVLRFNAPAIPAALDRLAAALGTEDAVDGLAELLVTTGAPRTLRELGMKAEDVPLVAGVVAEHLPIANPRPVTPGSLEQILLMAYDEEGRHS